MPLDPVMQKMCLDFLLGGASVTAPGLGGTARFLQFATASPNYTSAFDGPFSPRGRLTFAAANSPQGSGTTLNLWSGTATAAGTALGWNIYESNVGGRRLFYGTFSNNNIACASADTPCVQAGNLKITLS